MISFPRRIAVLIYDAISLLAVVYFASFLPVILAKESIEPNKLSFQIFLILVSASYFVYCWRRGQTLGMKAWKVFILSSDGQKPSSYQLWIRFLIAGLSLTVFGLGYFCALFNLSKKTWHDQASGTYLIHLPNSGDPVVPYKSHHQKKNRKN